MLVMGSIISPLMVISICMTSTPNRTSNRCMSKLGGIPLAVKRQDRFTFEAVRVCRHDPHRHQSAQPLRLPGEIDHRVAAGASRELRVASAAARIHQDLLDAADVLTIASVLHVALQCLQL